MKPVSFENGELLDDKGKSVEIEAGQHLLVIEGDELTTAITGLESAAKSSAEVARRQAGVRPSSSGRLFGYAEKFGVVARGFQEAMSFKPNKS